jgi:hypothetical protein
MISDCVETNFELLKKGREKNKRISNTLGLKVKSSKSTMVPINISEERIKHLAATFNCLVDSLPFNYLGCHLA